MANFNYFGATDKGKAKEFNEDIFNAFVEQGVLFLVVADGLGGQEGLDFASAIANYEFQQHIEKNLKGASKEAIEEVLDSGIFWINKILLAYKRANPDMYSGFATTLTVCAINESKNIVIRHVGNSRLYLLRGENFTQVSKDHTEAQDLLDKGEITKEEARTHPARGTLTRALGVTSEVKLDTFSGSVNPEDIIMLCTDGITNLLADAEIQEIIVEAGDSEKACEWLIEGSNQRGGIDNMVILFTYVNY